MNDFAELLVSQLGADIRTLPERIRARLSPEGQVARAGTIAEIRAIAKRRVPRVVFDYVDGGAGDEVTLRRNTAELRATELCPRVLVDVSDVDTATTVLGEPVALPLLSAPMGLTGLMHPAAEAAIARVMHEAGSVSVLAAMASCSIEEVAAAAPGPLWFQAYIWRDRGLVADVLRRAQAAGMSVLVLTLDVPCSSNRDRDRRNGFSIPPRVTLAALAGGVLHPGWSASFVRNPRIRWGNLPPEGGMAAATFSAQTNMQFDPSATWDEIGWFRDRWDGRLVVKGILHPEDARQAVRLGAEAVIVSNHGGRQLDGAPAAIRALPTVTDAVAGDAEVYFDSGIRRGADIVKALALGARACLTGRALAYGLGAAGEAGARRALEILRRELRIVLALTGCPSVQKLDRTWVVQCDR
ncbi:MAG TPA: alpha-hydroxy acid oxidase [Streptosporangiaceae bacterium]|jgi:isopentenyl diphosphate isomerase/L-lactate dehydrogenase-like FMN-dependent dehydrogenase|nr:alpha-hydroxy acid oxidase [Streptosporangiaceae bacterium]